MSFLDTELLNNPLSRWLVAAGIAVVSILLLRLINGVVVRRLGGLAAKTETGWDDLIAYSLSRTNVLFLISVGLYAGAQFLVLPAQVVPVFRAVVTLAVFFQIGLWLSAAVTSWLDAYRRERLAEDPAAATTIGALRFVGRLGVWALVLLLGLQNLGVNITALMTGMGVGGIAVALAVQNILGDLFASLSIVLDKPFVIGDFLVVGDLMGSVEFVGLRTTRVRSLSGEQLVFSNSDLLNSRIRNYGRLSERRVVFSIGVTYQTPRSQLERIPATIREAVQGQEHTRFDRSHLSSFGDFAILFETVYYVTRPDYNLYMDIQQAINLAIHEAFERDKIEFAYPTQTLHLVGAGPPAG